MASKSNQQLSQQNVYEDNDRDGEDEGTAMTDQQTGLEATTYDFGYTGEEQTFQGVPKVDLTSFGPAPTNEFADETYTAVAGGTSARGSNKTNQKQKKSRGGPSHLEENRYKDVTRRAHAVWAGSWVQRSYPSQDFAA